MFCFGTSIIFWDATTKYVDELDVDESEIPFEVVPQDLMEVKNFVEPLPQSICEAQDGDHTIMMILDYSIEDELDRP